jgi:hypothetical protein
MITGILSCIGGTTWFGSVVMTVNVSSSVPAFRSFQRYHRPASAYGGPSLIAIANGCLFFASSFRHS